MPKTNFQKLVFTLIMVFVMVFCMTLYNLAIENGGLDLLTLKAAATHMWAEYAVCFVLIFFVISHFAQHLAFRIFDPKNDNPMLVILSVQCMTVLMAVSSMSLMAVILHSGVSSSLVFQWIEKTVICFPAALCIQIFFAGPLVRCIFRKIFSQQLKTC